jgi:sec-independent protein translocase protein TatB
MSFWELVVVGVVALLVLGPEKLPGAIRTVTGTIRSIREFGHQMKSELSDELRVHELHEKLRQAEEKGLLGLSADEINALAELRQAAADVNNPYGQPVQPATEITPQLPAAIPPASTPPAVAAPVVQPAVAPSSGQPTAQAHEHKTPT